MYGSRLHGSGSMFWSGSTLDCIQEKVFNILFIWLAVVSVLDKLTLRILTIWDFDTDYPPEVKEQSDAKTFQHRFPSFQ